MKNSDKIFLIAAFISFLLSVSLWFNGQQQAGLFVGIWVPTIISCAAYLKLISKDLKEDS
ncbi:MAG: hypothetical protein ABJF11_03525 [Reichenbachiella sp.]|uniref:hypothetical protein n=1 Tax=Reichenbachiella sp. TaxID=2184521 RepID=UPI003266E5AF